MMNAPFKQLQNILQLGRGEGAIASLTRAATLAEGTEFEFLRNAALEKLQKLQP